MSEVKWIKLATDIFNNRKIRQIENMPDGDAIIVIWVKLLCLAGNVNDNGFVYLTEEIPYTEEMLATEFGKPLQTVRLALGLFQNFGMLEVIDDIYHVSSWEKYQNVEELERLKEQNRIRVRRYREKQKMLEGNENVTLQSNDNVMLRNGIDKEEEKEREKNKKNKYKDIIFDSDLSDPVKEAVQEFLKMRKLIKSPMTEHALEMMIQKLKKMTEDPAEQIAILEQSIQNSWKGIFPVSKKGLRLNEVYQEITEWASGEE